ncbi:MAG: polyprenyl synthetase family protein, partial [Candidatus Nezhaarchaeales archaeon]
MLEEASAKLVEELGDELKGYVERINEALVNEALKYRGSSFYKPLLYALEKGKRLRPLILLLAFEAVGGKGENPLPAAVAVELLHTESLIHDDIIDGEVNRRGRLAFYLKWGYNAAILSADFMLGMVLRIVSTYRDSRVADELAEAVMRMCEGELLELLLIGENKPISMDTYINVAALKTASLFKASTKIGAIIGGGNEGEVEALSRYGYALGLAYQARDDALDIDRKEEEL